MLALVRVEPALHVRGLRCPPYPACDSMIGIDDALGCRDKRSCAVTTWFSRDSPTKELRPAIRHFEASAPLRKGRHMATAN
jgi:hypothetical protein